MLTASTTIRLGTTGLAERVRLGANSLGCTMSSLAVVAMADWLGMGTPAPVPSPPAESASGVLQVTYPDWWVGLIQAAAGEGNDILADPVHDRDDPAKFRRIVYRGAQTLPPSAGNVSAEWRIAIRRMLRSDVEPRMFSRWGMLDGWHRHPSVMALVSPTPFVLWTESTPEALHGMHGYRVMIAQVGICHHMVVDACGDETWYVPVQHG